MLATGNTIVYPALINADGAISSTIKDMALNRLVGLGVVGIMEDR
jgi:hypothetical protein